MFEFLKSLCARTTTKVAVAMIGLLLLVFLILRTGTGGLSVGTERTYTVVKGDLRISFSERGEIKASKSVEILSEVEGKSTIVSVVPEGASVKKGQLLLEMDSSELTQSLNQQQITVESAESSLEQAEEQVSIQQSLNDSALQKAQLELMLAKIDLEKYTGIRGTAADRWDPFQYLRGEESLLADVTGRARAEIDAAIERAERQTPTLYGVPAIGSTPDVVAPPAAANPPEAVAPAPTATAPGSAPLPPATPADPASQPATEVPTEATRIVGSATAVVPAPSSTPAVSGVEPEVVRIVPGSTAAPEATPDPVAEEGAATKPEARAGDFILAFKKAVADVKIAASEVARAKNQKEWTERLAEKGYATGTELVADTLSLEKAELNEQQAKGNLELFLTYTWLKDYSKYKSAVDQARAALQRAAQEANAKMTQAQTDLRAKEATRNLSKKRLQKIQEQLEKSKIYAPQDGMVVYQQDRQWGRDRIIEAGAEVHENQMLMRLPDVSTMAVEVQVHESWVDQVRDGLTALVSIDALPNLQLRGKVTKVGILPDQVNRWLNPDLKVYKTEITLDDVPEIKLVRPGMSARVEVVIAMLRDVLYLPVQSVTTIDKKQVCFVQRGGQFISQPIEVGRHNESHIEVIRGIQEGDVVQLTAPAPTETTQAVDIAEDAGPAIPGVPGAWDGPAGPGGRAAPGGGPGGLVGPEGQGGPGGAGGPAARGAGPRGGEGRGGERPGGRQRGGATKDWSQLTKDLSPEAKKKLLEKMAERGFSPPEPGEMPTDGEVRPAQPQGIDPLPGAPAKGGELLPPPKAGPSGPGAPAPAPPAGGNG